MFLPAYLGRLTLSTILGASCCALATPCSAGKLTTARSQSGYQSSSSNGSSSESSDDSCPWYVALFSHCEEGDRTRVGVAEGETRGSYAELEQHRIEQRARNALRQTYFFLPYPYANGGRGNAVRLHLPQNLKLAPSIEPPDGSLSRAQTALCIDKDCFLEPNPPLGLGPSQRRLQSYRLQLFADMGMDQDGLVRVGLGGVLNTNRRFGLDSRWTYWLESLPGGGTDSLWLGDLNLRYDALTLSALTLSLGAGPRALLDGEGGTAGPNATLTLELYPGRPFVLRAEGDLGTLGTAPVWEVQGSLGVVFEHFEVYAGYSLLSVDGLDFESLYGGMRLHF